MARQTAAQLSTELNNLKKDIKILKYRLDELQFTTEEVDGELSRFQEGYNTAIRSAVNLVKIQIEDKYDV